MPLLIRNHAPAASPAPLTLAKLPATLATLATPDWLVGPCGLTRDSDPVERSNFEVAMRALDDADWSDWEILYWTHWACGWVQEIVTRPGSRAAEIAAELRSRLADYPVLDEAHLSQLEREDEGPMSSDGCIPIPEPEIETVCGS